jgi:hypothetical protein
LLLKIAPYFIDGLFECVSLFLEEAGHWVDQVVVKQGYQQRLPYVKVYLLGKYWHFASRVNRRGGVVDLRIFFN